MAGPPVRERYNAKARGSTAGGGHKKRKRPKIKEVNEDGTPVDSPAAPPVEVETEGDGRGKMSSKKRKRMDSYINKKLKTADRLQTLNLLASLAPSAQTSAALASTGSLGQNPMAPTSAMERHDWIEDRAVRKGIEKLNRRTGGPDSEESDSEDEADGSEAPVEAGPSRRKVRAVEVIEEVPRDSNPMVTTPAPAPVAAKPKKRKAKKSAWNPNLLSTQPGDESSSDFDSSDSAYDSASDDEKPEAAAAPAALAAIALPEAGPSSSRPRSLSPVPVPNASNKPAAVGSALKFALKPAPVGPTTFGGALKKSADGAAVQPRVVRRRQKMPLGRRSYAVDEDDDEGSSNSGSEDDDDSGDEDDSESGSDDEEEEENDEDEDEDDGEDDEEEEQAPKKRSLGFKSWAMKQMGQATPSDSGSTSSKPEPPPFAFQSAKTPRVAPQTGEFVGPLGAKMAIPASSLIDLNSKVDTARPKLARRASVAESRMDLPILAEEQSIVEAIRMNPVVIIAGETGSGKTTQVPQMLYEAGFGFKASANPGMIAVTQPRRVAAVSLSNRVRDELGFKPSSSVVAHQIRYSSTTSPETAIKFMTDGVLLRELASDFLLSRYSVVVVDEAHERGVNTDVLIGVLSRVAKLREAKWRARRDDKSSSQESAIKPLRIVIMSATLRIEDFASNASLFTTPPPVIHIPARQHPVTMHFSRKTTGDYVQEAYKKVCKIHARLPQGGVLVFMTGQAEIMQLCRRLEKKYAEKSVKAGAAKKSRKEEKEEKAERSTNEVELAAEEREAEDVELGQDDDLAADVDDGDAESDPEALDSDDDEAGLNLEIDEASDTPMTVLPLYSLLSNEQQMRVFQPPPEGHRLVIIATNVAETSLTIPGIRYVVDSGRSKERDYDIASGVQSFKVSWISKASANQRAGRAGRTGPGHCYRLYSSALFEDHFAKFSTPEILRMPIEGVVLQMKSMNIDQVVNFPFPTPPDRISLAKAEKLLESLGALEKPTMTRMIAGKQHTGLEGGKITDLGRAMSRYPVSPRFAKMLVIGDQHNCLPYIMTIVAGLSVGDPFIHENTLDAGKDDVNSDDEGAKSEDEDVKRASRKAEIGHIRSEELRAKEERKDMRKKYFDSQARFMGLGGGTSDMFKLLAAVGAYEYDPTASFCHQNFLRLKAMQEIQQLRGQICNITKQPMHRLAPPTDTQTKVIRQILTASSLDRIAVRQDIFLKRSTAFPSCRGVAYRAVGLGAEEVFVHPSSALFHRPAPEYITFHEITRSQGGRGRTWVKGVTKINPGWLSSLGKGSCTFSKPEVAVTKGRAAGGKVVQLKEGEREVLVTPHFGDLGVDLPVVRMKQRREGTRWVLVE